MRNVVVIGGGLTGLSACLQLNKLGLRYTVIELRRRFGGTIGTGAQNGFVMDGSAFAFSSLAAEPWLHELGLCDQVLPLGEQAFIFRDGTESLTRALAARLGGGQLTRMAVSSLGILGKSFTICLENGMMFDAGAIILALPVPFAARALYNLAPDASQRLLDIRRESIWHVALGLHKGDLPGELSAHGLAYLHITDHPARLPTPEHRLIQLGWSASPDSQPDEIIRAVSDSLGMPRPIASSAQVEDVVHFDSAANIRDIRAMIPAGISLVGSDYIRAPSRQPGIAQLAERINAGRDAANQAAEFLKAKRR